MSFLSTVRINPWRDASRKMLSNPHLVHGMVGAGIPNGTTSERTLWRWETPHGHSPSLLILTETKPDWTHIVEQAGWPDAAGEHVAVRDYTPLFAHLARGRQFAFRVTVNPTQNTMTPVKASTTQQQRRDDGYTRGFRLSHVTAVQQQNWFLTRTSKWGFEIPAICPHPPAPGMGAPNAPAPDCRIIARERLRFRKNKNSPPVVITAVTIEGRLAVADPDLLRSKLLSGIGPGKAYGCGLLTLAPLPGHVHA